MSSRKERHLPAKEMSTEELAACRAQLKRRWENRKVDEALIRRAWDTAHRVAAMLYADFGATHVAVFGSLAEREWFTQASDIDVAVWGLSDSAAVDARWEIGTLAEGFKIDLINVETSTTLFCEQLQRQAIPIKNGDKCTANHVRYEYQQAETVSGTFGRIYEMNRRKLTQRLADERTKIQHTIANIVQALEDIEVMPAAAKKYIEESISSKLANVYRGIEKIFERIAREVDMHMPSGSRWHNDLLAQMAEQRPERPPVISKKKPGAAQRTFRLPPSRQSSLWRRIDLRENRATREAD